MYIHSLKTPDNEEEDKEELRKQIEANQIERTTKTETRKRKRETENNKITTTATTGDGGNNNKNNKKRNAHTIDSWAS